MSKKTNSESFKQLIVEAKRLKCTIEDIYYSTHIGVWLVKSIDGTVEEFDTILEIVHDVICNHNEKFEPKETMVL